MKIKIKELKDAIMSVNFNKGYYDLQGNTEEELDEKQKKWIFIEALKNLRDKDNAQCVKTAVEDLE